MSISVINTITKSVLLISTVSAVASNNESTNWHITTSVNVFAADNSSSSVSFCPKLHIMSKNFTCLMIVLAGKSFDQAESTCITFSDYLISLETVESWNQLISILNRFFKIKNCDNYSKINSIKLTTLKGLSSQSINSESDFEKDGKNTPIGTG